MLVGYRLILTFVLFVFLIHGCASSTPRSHTPPPSKPGYPKPYKVLGKWYQPLPHSEGFRQRGIASWYGRDFHGKKTSNGEIYNMYAMTAAHKTLPLGTYVEVHNRENSRSIVVRINDRGPFVRGRIIDLTLTAASEFGMAEDGVVPVQIEALGYARKKRQAGKLVRVYEKPASYELGDFTIQVGAFTERENALRLRASLSRKYRKATVKVFDQGSQRFYRVRVGQYSRLNEAEAAAERLQEKDFPNAFAVASDR